jgi:MoaA/NifB/PqqE/SkfB family radical SAM enzyme
MLSSLRTLSPSNATAAPQVHVLAERSIVEPAQLRIVNRYFAWIGETTALDWRRGQSCRTIRPVMRLPFERLLYSPFLAQLVVTRRCNLSCKYCNEFDEVSDPVPAETLKARMRKLKELGTFSLELTGGEPLLHPDIAELIRYARSLGFYKVMMISNAYLFNERRVEELNQAGLMELQVSVDGVLPNDITVKVLKALKPKLEVLSRFAKFRVVLSSVLGAAPPAEVLEVTRYAIASGFRPRVLVLHDGNGGMNLSEGERDTLRQIQQAIGGRRFREARDYRRRLLEEGRAPFKCRAGSRYLYVDEFGVVHWCSQTLSSFGIPLEEYSRETLREQFDTIKDCAPTCTVGCVRTQSKPDEWRPQRRRWQSERVRLPLARTPGEPTAGKPTAEP